LDEPEDGQVGQEAPEQVPTPPKFKPSQVVPPSQVIFHWLVSAPAWRLMSASLQASVPVQRMWPLSLAEVNCADPEQEAPPSHTIAQKEPAPVGHVFPMLL
jgi:hypothetical protein